jgi:hypothetical protein
MFSLLASWSFFLQSSLTLALKKEIHFPYLEVEARLVTPFELPRPIKRLPAMNKSACENIPRILIIALSSLIISACAKPIPSTHLIPNYLGNEFQINMGPLYKSICVESVGGGNKTSPMLYPDIGDAELNKALVDTLQTYHYLCSSEEDCKYKLSVFIVEIDRQRRGFTMTVTTFVRYKILSKENDNIIYDEIVDASDTKTLKDASVGITRLRIAQEESMKKNIAKFINRLFLLNGKP